MPLGAASGALRSRRQMCNNSYVAVMSARGVGGGGGQSLKNTLGMQDGSQCWCGCWEHAGFQEREVHIDTFASLRLHHKEIRK